jgi:hypothetical protein
MSLMSVCLKLMLVSSVAPLGSSGSFDFSVSAYWVIAAMEPFGTT